MFDPILVPLDGSLLAECVLPHASTLARTFKARILLVRVLDRNQESEKSQLFDLVNWQINKAGANLYLDKVSSGLKKSGLAVTTTAIEGPVSESIIDFAQTQNVKLIVLSSHGRSGISKWGISSVTQKIIFSAPSSVLIIRAQPPTEEGSKDKWLYDHIMVPLDGSKRAEIVLPMVAMFAHFHKSQIHLVHVIGTPEMARQLPLSHEDQELSDKIIARNQEEASHYLEQIRVHSPLDGIEVKTHIIASPNVAVALHEFSENEKIDLVALSAHGYTGNNQWPYGSMVNNFILYSRIPLLIVQDLPVREETEAPDVVQRHLTEQ